MGPNTTFIDLNLVQKILNDCTDLYERRGTKYDYQMSEVNKLITLGELLKEKKLGAKNTLKNIYYEYRKAELSGEPRLKISIKTLKNLERFTGNQYFIESIESDILTKVNWFLFHYHKEKDDHNGQKIPGILKAYVTFLKNKTVILKSIFKGNVHTYIGKYKIIDNHALSLSLTLSPDNTRNLQIMLHIGQNQTYEIALGVFQNITDIGSIVSGTIIMKSNIDSNLEIDPEFIPFDQVKDKIPKPIYTFLNNKESNLLKIQPDVSTIKDLDRVLNDYHNLKKQRMGNPTKKLYQLFISAPSTFSIPLLDKTIINEESDYRMVANDIAKVREIIIEKTQFKNICCLVESNNFLDAKYNLIKLYDEMVKGIDQSERFLLVYHKILGNLFKKPVKQSGIMLELGMALKLEKPCYILCQKGLELPKFINAAIAKQLIRCEYYESIESLIAAETEYWQWFFNWE